ncbi:hypothetical protein [Flavobacterium wongokense]|uniref:hypothetical protein n=1 Tax=Flavobacterium wongokense TaxID=2910674 RepID=UPI001F34C784|nr:hypothetical protein [Flavobacterium sp. WG47]MCF6131852.1 hypothetical protein [Flavobacterium sp. WG47]
MSEISKSYKGDIKNGLAHGKGTAKGEDTYSGEFKNGLPDGKGKYTYKNGNTFSGYFSKGLKNGKGVFNFSLAGNAMTQKGYWVNGDYVGITDPAELYIVSNISGIESYSIKKVDDNSEGITFSVIKGGMKYVPSSFKIVPTSGQMMPQGKSLSITNYNLPVNCEVSFTVNKSGNIVQCYFTFEILKPGKYEVELINP